MTIKGYEVLDRARKEYPCKAKVFRDENGEIHAGSCLRRSCPVCASLYAFIIGEAVKELHGNEATHIVFTVDDKNIDKFATAEDYIRCKNYTRGLIQERMGIMARYPEKKWSELHSVSGSYRVRRDNPPERVLESRNRLAKSSRLFAKGIRKIREMYADKLERSYNEVGYLASTEFGERNTKRIHKHFVPFVHFAFLERRLMELGIVLSLDKDRGIYILRSEAIWKYGMIRIKPMEGGADPVKYLSSYATKNSPGRVSMDRQTSEYIRQIRSLYVDEDSNFEFQSTGRLYREYEEFKKKTFLKLFEDIKARLMNNETVQHSERGCNQIIKRRYGNW